MSNHSGIIRRIDDLGRLVIPRDLRRQLDIIADDALELSVQEIGGEKALVAKKYSVFGNGMLSENHVKKGLATLESMYIKGKASDEKLAFFVETCERQFVYGAKSELYATSLVHSESYFSEVVHQCFYGLTSKDYQLQTCDGAGETGKGEELDIFAVPIKYEDDTLAVLFAIGIRWQVMRTKETMVAVANLLA